MTDARNDKLDVACLALGRLIAAQCPPGFEKAVLSLDLHEGRSLVRIMAASAEGAEVQMPLSEEPARNILETMRVVQREMAEEDPRPWKGALVTLRKGGHFDLDVSY
jgi:hypothetical protein